MGDYYFYNRDFLACGGYALVYKGKNSKNGNVVALKQLTIEDLYT